ncbi:MAG TPA: RNA 2',3'-cyclic phosphodiesterase [Pirellulales bacterium]|nr:RNA 2',3'-cyclic phosphodiesterase [Pirellulales bacterium]
MAVRSLRTFIAVEMSSEVRSRARQLVNLLQGTGAKVTWVKPEAMHLTLKFLGEVELIDTPAVCEAVKTAVAELPPFEIVVSGAGAFPAADRPRTIWLGVSEGNGELVVLHDAVERALAKLGFRQENRRFRPHLTLGRVRGDRDLRELGQLIVKHADFVGGVSSVDEVTVFSSELEAEGPLHEPLAVAPLNGR